MIERRRPSGTARVGSKKPIRDRGGGTGEGAATHLRGIGAIGSARP